METSQSSNFKNHKHSRSVKPSRKKITPLLLLIAGILLLFYGVYLSFHVVFNSTDLFIKIVSAIGSSDVGNVSAKPLTFFYGGFLAIFYLPIFLISVINLFFLKNIKLVKWISIITSGYVLLLHVVLSSFLFSAGKWYLSEFFVASSLLLSFSFIQCLTSYVKGFSRNLDFIIPFFYFSLLLYSSFYGKFYEYLFTYCILITIGIFFIGQKIKKPSLNLLNQAFAIGFMGLFWLRKFVVNSKPDYLLVFLVFAAAFYILFYTITLLASHKEHYSLKKWGQLIMLWGNFLFFALTLGFVIVKYYGLAPLWILPAGMLTLHLAGMSLMKRYNSAAWLLPHYIIAIVLASLVLPLLMQQSMLLLFAACMSIGLLYLSLQYKGKVVYGAFIVSFFIMLAIMAYYWLLSYLPAILLPIEVPGNELMWHGVLSTMAVTITLALSYWMLIDEDVPTSKFSINGSLLKRMVKVLLLLSTFALAGWIASFIAIVVEGSTFYVPMAWFFTGSSFFIAGITWFTGKKSFLKLPVLYSGFVFMLMYLVLVQWRMITINNILIETGEYLTVGIVLHAINLFLLAVLSVMVIRRVVTQAVKKPAQKAALQFISIVFISVVLCFEYENLYVLITASKAGVAAGYINSDALLSGNRYLPFSVVSGIFMVVVLFKSLLDNDNSMRNIAFVLIGLILLKVFFYDFDILSTGMRAVVFITTGMMLLGIAMVYPRLQKEGKQRYERRHKKKKIEA